MKRIFLLLGLMVSLLSADIRWAEDLDDALEIAQKEDKIVMMMFSMRGCRACRFMERKVYAEPKVTKAFNKDFIGVHIDVKEDFVPKGYDYFATPTLFFIDKDKKLLDKQVGGLRDYQFLDKLSEVRKLAK